MWDEYFQKAALDIDAQWNDVIEPLICEFDLTTVLELAPGWGRNTQKLAARAKRIYAVDLNQDVLDSCRDRIGKATGDCDIQYIRNSGNDIPGVADGDVTAVYCWDAAVHFDRSVVRDYVREFARVMKRGAMGFVHHSDLGTTASRNIKSNPGWRSNVDRAFFAECCRKSGLRVDRQVEIPWGEITDCATIFSKPDQ